jgi:hypothetical protein
MLRLSGIFDKKMFPNKLLEVGLYKTHVILNKIGLVSCNFTSISNIVLILTNKLIPSIYIFLNNI